MKKILLNSLKVVLILYIIVCGLLFVFQEKLIFYPQKLNKNYQFSFDQKFIETTIKTNDGIVLNRLLFKADSSKGLIFYLHGSVGSLSSWGKFAKTYTDLGYDVFMPDYRGYGKSEGSINGQGQFFQDLQTVYNELKTKYAEDKIIVLGYSVGTGLASKIASTNKPKLLILQAPYYSLPDMMQHTYPIIPTFILKYKFETYAYNKDCEMPIIIFHGNQDEVVYYGSSLSLKEQFKQQDTLITLNGQGHDGITDNEEYRTAIRKILMQ
ncbi:MAG: alpha/beta fold hydrolase [Bacteroidota bacterium]